METPFTAVPDWFPWETWSSGWSTCRSRRRARAPLDPALPASPNLVRPGWYLLTVLSTAGVPSPAAWVRLS